MNLLKAMISQPMSGLSDEEIEQTRQKAISVLRSKGYEVVNTYFDEWHQNPGEDVINVPLAFMAKALEKMAQCNMVYFTKGWMNYRGCRMEHEIAMCYGLSIKYEK